jgi:hypothetical protein
VAAAATLTWIKRAAIDQLADASASARDLVVVGLKTSPS